jgi:hypothetical protein
MFIRVTSNSKFCQVLNYQHAGTDNEHALDLVAPHCRAQMDNATLHEHDHALHTWELQVSSKKTLLNSKLKFMHRCYQRRAV